MMPLFKQNPSSKQTRPLANITQKMTLAYSAVVLILTFSLLIVASLYHAVIDIILLMVFLALISLIVVFFMSLYFGQTIQKAIDGLITDINERQQTEEALKQAKQAAEEANLAKSQFLLSSCHELRTPFCAIIGYSEMLCMDAEEKGLDNFAKEKGLADFVGDLNRIHSAGKHLLGLINDYTDLCRLESGEMNICNETFELSHVLDEVIEITQPLVERKSNTLQVEMDETLGEQINGYQKMGQS